MRFGVRGWSWGFAKEREVDEGADGARCVSSGGGVGSATVVVSCAVLGFVEVGLDGGGCVMDEGFFSHAVIEDCMSGS